MSNGITTRPGRHTAIITLAADVPAPVLAKLTGMHIVTAVRWGKYAKRDWAAYVAERVEDTSIKAGARNRAPEK